MKTGGIPYVAVMNRTDEKIDQYLEGIYNTVIVKDIEQRQARREKEGGKRKITDIALLKTIARYLNWERYFTHVLEEHTRGTDLEYHKKKLNKQYLYANTMNTISKFLLKNNIVGQTLDFSCDLEGFMVG